MANLLDPILRRVVAIGKTDFRAVVTGNPARNVVGYHAVNRISQATFPRRHQPHRRIVGPLSSYCV